MLSADGRVTTVVDRQGSALMRPIGRQRWTPLEVGGQVMPGDLLRTPLRGANATELDLVGGGKLVLGPGAQVEMPEAGVVRLLAGDIEVRGTKGRPTTVYGSANFTRKIVDTAVVRGKRGITELLPKPPRWLVGYRASTTDEWMGSLVANVDGKNVPLSVGYHKVTVDVRDQIGRTTVEQSFVNSTDGTAASRFGAALRAGG